MDNSPITFTSLALIVLLLIIIVMFTCHYLGPRATTWMRSNKEEKIGLSKNKLFHANGYMIHSGSEFLLSTSGSFKRFDTIDKEDHHGQSNNHTPNHKTTPLWNLPEADCEIPPQPLRPAPAPQAPGSGSSTSKTVTFSFNEIDETTPTSETHSNCHDTPCIRTSSLRATPLPRPLEAPPPPRLSTSSSATLSATAIPRPVAKRQVSLQNGIAVADNGSKELREQDVNGTMTNASITKITPKTTNGETNRRRARALMRRNSSTNPFLCESFENLPEAPKHATALQTNINTNASSKKLADAEADAIIPTAGIEESHNATIAKSNGCTNGNHSNPFYEDAGHSSSPDELNEIHNNAGSANADLKKNGYQTSPTKYSRPMLRNQDQQFRNRSFSETETSQADFKGFPSNISPAGILKLTNTTNPFSGLSQKVKGPHMLQKTISEDFLFRKLGHGAGASGGHATWSFGRSLLRQDSTFSIGRRNSSQCSLDSTSGSLDGVELERAISCDSVNSDSSFILCDFDQPYTQITGYLCVGLQYDKSAATNEGMELTVTVLEAKGLICPFTIDQLDTFVRIYLVPDQAGAMQTKVITDSQTPSYNESFTFWLKKQQGRHSLWFHLYHNGVAHTLIGEAEMEIDETPRPITTWIPLSDSRKCNAKWGELMFSLSYLPTAERLTIVVVKARNLKLEVQISEDSAPQKVQNIFVKVYLMNQEKKVLKKRTSLKRKDRGPIFNESMIFSVPPHSLTTVQLRLTVFGVVDNGTITPLGHVIAGSCATGKGLRHWHQMLSSLRKPVAMWHVLRRAVNQPIFTGGAEAVVAALQSTAIRAKRNSVF